MLEQDWHSRENELDGMVQNRMRKGINGMGSVWKNIIIYQL
jgi:hypothetical protein